MLIEIKVYVLGYVKYQKVARIDLENTWNMCPFDEKKLVKKSAEFINI